MSESVTRNFISQWSYDGAQGREDARDETAMQWLSVDRVAEQMRQRKEHHVEEDIDAMDFETRAAALEAHFFQATERRSNRRSPKKVSRARPQSASLLRRTETNATSNSCGGMSKRPRPQSAKTRSETPPCSTYATKTENQVAWKVSAHQNPSKWREMLARGPEFKQLALRRLEIETYELLYNTLQHQQVVDTKPTTRRRKRRTNEKGPSKPQDPSPVLACGSGLHLARSRKKRQQEHDRQMMLGKGQKSSRSSEQDKAKGAKGDKQSIQDKTRQRNKLLSKKKPEKQLQVNQVLNPDTQRDGPSLQRRSSASRTARMPWVPSGSASSLAIRGIFSETGKAHLTQEERIAQLLDVFQSHTNSHLRRSKHERDQLKRAQQSAKTAKAKDPRTIEHTIKCPLENVNHLKRSRPGPAAKLSSNRASEFNVPVPVSQGNQENDLAEQYPLCRPLTFTVPVLDALELASETEPTFSASPGTPKLVIPPLKLPPNLWKYQLSNESQDGIPETPCHNQPNIGLGYADTEAQSSVGDSTRSSSNGNSPDNLSAGEVEHVESWATASGTEEDVRYSGEYPNELDSCEYDHDVQEIISARRRTIEEGYLMDDNTEQADSRLLIQDTVALPVEFSQESQGEEAIRPILLEDWGHVTNEPSGSGSSDAIDTDLLFSASPRTPKLVVPPLKLAPNLWKHQLTSESQDGLPETPCHDEPITEAQSQVDSVVASICSSSHEKSRDILSTGEVVENGARTSGVEEAVRPSGEYSNDDEQEITSARRRTIEEGYLMEDYPEQADNRPLSQNTEALPDEFSQESQGEEPIRLILLEDWGRVTNDPAGSGSGDDIDLKGNSAIHTPVEQCDRDLSASMTEGASSPVPSREVEIMISPTKEIGVQLSPEVRQLAVENESADTRKEMSSNSNVLKVAKFVQNVDSATVTSEQKASEEHQDLSGRSSNKSNAADVLSYQDIVDVADILAESADSIADFQMESNNSASEAGGNSEGDRTEAAIRFTPNGQECTTDHPGDSDPSEMLFDPEHLDILVQLSPLQQQPVTTDSDAKNVHTDLRGDRPALSDTFELPVRTSRIFDTIGAVNDNVCEIELEDTKHAQRNESHETGSDSTATIVQPPLITIDTADTIIVPQPAECTQGSARLSDTSAENTALDIDETVVNALPDNEELTQVKLTPLVDMPASPPNDRAELLLQMASTGRAHLEAASYDQIRLDPTELSRVTIEAKSPDTKSKSRSPKRKAKKPKTTAGDNSSSPKQAKRAELEPEWPSQSTAVEVANLKTIPAQVLINHSKAALAERDPLRHQQELTRSFLERVSSRKLLESESASSRPASCREQVERDGHLLATESTTTTLDVVMDVASQVEDNAKSVKERKDDDRDSALPLERESVQAVNDCESTVESYPATVEGPTTTPSTENDDMVTSFDRVRDRVRDGLFFSSVVADPNANPEKVDPVIQSPEEEGSENVQEVSYILTSGDPVVLAPERPVSTITDNLTPHTSLTSSEGVVPPPPEHRRASCKIQAQYRCFVRRRLLLDQLQFVLAKERRQARKKSRQVGRKVKTVDLVASEDEGLVTTVAIQANSADSALEVVQQGAPGSVSSEIGVEMSPRALPSKEAEPLDKNAKLNPSVTTKSRQSSCEYAFDLFDGSKDTSGEMIPVLVTGSGVGNMVEAASKNDDQQEGHAALPVEDATATNSRELLQAPLLTSSRNELESNYEPALAVPAANNSMTFAELAFSADKEGHAMTDTNAKVQPQWERYVDSTTSKSFYYNPVTNETQWTTPAEQAANSFRTTPTTPHAASQSAGSWQEFLDEASGQMFYYNTQTGESSWEPPAALNESLNDGSEIVRSDATAASAWVMYIDPASQAPYYVNVETLATSWERPEDFVATELKTGEDHCT